MATRSADFEVAGTVQGVFFRKHTKKTADALGIVGWCMNTPTGLSVFEVELNAQLLERLERRLLS